MITEIVTFEIRKEMGREQVIALFEESAKSWRAHPKLYAKNYLYDAEAGIAGGVYTWDSVDDARDAHGDAFLARIEETFGSTPRFQYFETPVIVRNQIGAG